MCICIHVFLNKKLNFQHSVNAYTVTFAGGKYVVLWTEVNTGSMVANVKAIRISDDGLVIDESPVLLLSVPIDSSYFQTNLRNSAVSFDDVIVFNLSKIPYYTYGNANYSKSYIIDPENLTVLQEINLPYPIVGLWGEDGDYLAYVQYESSWNSSLQKHSVLFDLTRVEEPEPLVSVNTSRSALVSNVRDAVLVDDIWFIAHQPPEVFVVLPPLELSRVSKRGQILLPVELDANPSRLENLWIGKLEDERLMAVWGKDEGITINRIHKSGFKSDGDGEYLAGNVTVSEALPSLFVQNDKAIFSGSINRTDWGLFSLYTFRLDLPQISENGLSREISIGRPRNYYSLDSATIESTYLIVTEESRNDLPALTQMSAYLVNKYGALTGDRAIKTWHPDPGRKYHVPQVIGYQGKYLLGWYSDSDWAPPYRLHFSLFDVEAKQFTEEIIINDFSERGRLIALAADNQHAIAVIDDTDYADAISSLKFLLLDGELDTVGTVNFDYHNGIDNFDIIWLEYYYLCIWVNHDGHLVGIRLSHTGSIVDSVPFLISADGWSNDVNIVADEDKCHIIWVKDDDTHSIWYASFSYGSGPSAPRELTLPLGDFNIKLSVQDVTAVSGSLVMLVQHYIDYTHPENSIVFYNPMQDTIETRFLGESLGLFASLNLNADYQGFVLGRRAYHDVHYNDELVHTLSIRPINFTKKVVLSTYFDDVFARGIGQDSRYEAAENTLRDPLSFYIPKTILSSQEVNFFTEVRTELLLALESVFSGEFDKDFSEWWKLYAQYQILVANNRVVESMRVDGTEVLVDEEGESYRVSLRIDESQNQIMELLDEALHELAQVFRYMPYLSSVISNDPENANEVNKSLLYIVQAYELYLDVSVRKLDILAQRAAGKDTESAEYQTGIQFARKILSEISLASILLYHHLSEEQANSLGVARLGLQSGQLERTFDGLARFYPVAPGGIARSDFEMPNPSVPVPLQSTLMSIDRAKQSYESSLQESRTYDSNQTDLRTEMGRLREQYLNRLFELTGENPDQGRYTSGGKVFGNEETLLLYLERVLDPSWSGGRLGIERRILTKSEIDAELSLEVQENINKRKTYQQSKHDQLIEIQNDSAERLKAVDVARGRAQEITSLHRPVDALYVRETKRTGLFSRIHYMGTRDPEVAKSAEVTQYVYNPSAMTLARLNEDERGVHADIQKDILGAENEATLANFDLDYSQAQIQTRIAQVGTEISGMTVKQMEEQVIQLIDSYLRNDESLAEAYFNNPAYRLLRDERAGRAEASLRQAQTQAFRLAKRIEYEWAERWPRGLNTQDEQWDPKWNVFLPSLTTVYQAVNPYQVEDFVLALKEWDRQLRQSRTNPLFYAPSFGQAISLRRHILGLDDYTAFGAPKPYAEVQENLRLFREYIAANTLHHSIPGFPLLDSRKDAILLTFPLNLLALGSPVSNYFSAADTWNHKMVGFDFNLVGSLQGFRAGIGQTAQLSLMQRGTSVLKLYSSELGYIIFNPDPFASTNTDFVWGQPNFATYKHVTVQNAGRSANFKRVEFGVDQMYNRPVAATEWTLFIDNGRQVDLHLFWDQLEDIQILVSFRANTPPPIWIEPSSN